MRYLALAVILAGCPAVNVEQVDVHQPEVNVGDVGSNNNVDVNVDATEQPAPEQPAKVEPAPVQPPVMAQEIKRAEPEPEVAVKPEPEPAPEPCADDDRDGVCNADDTCPAGSDADADGTGYADGCESVLWAADVWITNPVSTTANYVEDQPGVIAIQPYRHADCTAEGLAHGVVRIEVPQHHGDEPVVVRMARPTEGRGGLMADCLEDGIESTTVGLLDGVSFTPSRALPEGSEGKHIVYFEVELRSFIALRVAPYSTTDVRTFSAVLRARGY